MNLIEKQAEVHRMALEKGWWQRDPATGLAVMPTTSRVMEALALLHSEVSEMVEEARLHRPETLGEVFFEDSGKPVGFASEAADVAIRLMDLCGALRIDLAKAISTKSAFNRTRSMRHGGKLA